MNDERYKSYLFISRVLRSDLFNALEQEVLTDAAEGLLLARELESGEIQNLELNARAALDGMAAARRIHRTTAAELFERIRDCGPAPQNMRQAAAHAPPRRHHHARHAATLDLPFR
jgi:hypothetical protein